MKKQERWGWVYVLTNLINGKEYVGQTVRGVLIRCDEHIKAALDKNNQKPLYRAIRKAYKKDGSLKNFTAEAIWYGPESKLNAAEIRFIRQRKTFIDWGAGYNLTTGGKQCRLSKQSILKLRRSLKRLYKNPVYCLKHQQSIIEYYKDAEAHQRHSDGNRRRYSNAVERKKTSDAANHEKLSAGQLRRFTKQSERQKASEAQRRRFENAAERKKASLGTARVFKDPAARRRQSEAARKAWANATPEFRAACGERSKLAMKNRKRLPNGRMA